MQSEAERIAAGLTYSVTLAVLACPFNSKGCGIPGGALAPYNEGNGHMGKAPLFRRGHRGDLSGDYTLTELGLAVREVLMRPPA